MSGGVIVYPATSGRGTLWNEVGSFDATTGVKTVLARTGYRHGMINWVSRTGTWTVYVDQSRQQSDAHPTTLWRLIAIEDTTGRTRTLDSSGGRPAYNVPRLRSDGGGVLWSSITREHRDALWWWKPSWPSPRLLVSGWDVDPATTRVDSERVVFHARPKPSEATLSTAGECWSVPIQGGQPVALTRTGGLVLDCDAGDGWLVWRQTRNPTDPNPDDVEAETPYELWAQHLHGKPVLIHQGAMPYTYPYTAGGMLLWMENDEQVILESLSHPHAVRRLPRAFVRFDPFGDDHFIGFVTERTRGYLDSAQLIDIS